MRYANLAKNSVHESVLCVSDSIGADFFKDYQATKLDSGRERTSQVGDTGEDSVVIADR